MIMIVRLVCSVAKNVQYLLQVAIQMDVELDTFTLQTRELTSMSVLNVQLDAFIVIQAILVIVSGV